MIRSGLRLKGVWMAALLLALGALSLQGLPAHAYLSDDQGQEGEVNLDFDDGGPGELPKHPGGGGGGSGTDDGTRRADPDDLSFNTPRVDASVVTVPKAAAPAWFGILRLWFEWMLFYVNNLR